MRGRLALAFMGSLALHGAIFLWAGRQEPPPRRAAIEVEFLRVEPPASEPPGPAGGAEEPSPGAGPAPLPEEAAPPAPRRAVRPIVPRETAAPIPRRATRPEPRPAPPPSPAAAEEPPPPDSLQGMAPKEEVLESDEEATSDTEGASTADGEASQAAPNAAGVGQGYGGGSGAGVAKGSGSGSGHGAGEGGGSGGGIDPHAALVDHLRAHAGRCYPAMARRRGIEGTVGLAFCIDDAGLPYRMEVEESSGSSLLDRAAMGCVIEGAAPLPAPTGCVRLDLPFRLR